MVKVRSSRRVAGLKPGDYDHEIGLVNHDGVDDDSHTVLTSDADTHRGSTTSRLISLAGDSGQEDEATRAEGSQANKNRIHDQQNSVVVVDVSEESDNRLRPEDSLPQPSTQPSIEVHGKYLSRHNGLQPQGTNHLPTQLRHQTYSTIPRIESCPSSHAKLGKLLLTSCTRMKEGVLCVV